MNNYLHQQLRLLLGRWRDRGLVALPAHGLRRT